MATPKKNKQQLRKEIADLRAIERYEKAEYKAIASLAVSKVSESLRIERGIKSEIKKTKHSLSRLSRNGFMFQGITIFQAKMIDKQMKAYRTLLSETDKRLKYLRDSINRRLEALRK